jgi:hypothetical protein
MIRIAIAAEAHEARAAFGNVGFERDWPRHATFDVN